MADALADLAEKIGDPSQALKRQQRRNDDVRFLLSHKEEWRREHANRWIAVHNQALAAVEDTQEEGIAAIEARRVPLTEVLLHFVSQERVVYVL